MSTETEYMNTSAAEENRKEIRNCFPIPQTTVHERPLVYLDNAATMQMPLPVIERMTAFYTRKNANIHRGIHMLSEMATEAYEKARETAGTFLGCEYAVRFSVAPYNTEEEIRYAADACRKICELIRKTSGSCRRQ